MEASTSSGVPEMNSPKNSLPKASIAPAITREVTRAMSAAERMPFLIRWRNLAPRFCPT